MELRDHLGNGLCFCLIHDKAFEVGLFTIDERLAVFVNPRESRSDSTIVQNLVSHQGENIRSARVAPLADALLEHWIRVDIDPLATWSEPIDVCTNNQSLPENIAIEIRGCSMYLCL